MKRKTIQSNPLDALGGKSNKKHIDTSNKMVYAKSKVNVKKNIKKETQLMAKDETALDILDNEIGSKDKKPAPKKSKKITPKSLHEQLALETVNKWSTWSAAAGFIPMPAVDTAAIGGVQVKMIHALCKVYDVPFKKEAVLAIISAVVGGSVATSLGSAAKGSVAKLIPGIGSIVSSFIQPGVAYGTTYALGRVFIDHFEKEGTLLDFDTSKVKKSFNGYFDNAKNFFKRKKGESNIVDVTPEPTK
tara:strand:+ start:1724 stop:2461 length:738 start_codon:yes stop_codon:yes gene_type:complete